jgi:hypothetical protein
MPFLPSLPKGASLLNLFKAFPETSKPLIEFHEVLLRGSSPFTEARARADRGLRLGPESMPLLPRRAPSHSGIAGCSSHRDR